MPRTGSTYHALAPDGWSESCYGGRLFPSGFMRRSSVSSVSFRAVLTALTLGSSCTARAAEHDLGVGPSIGFVQLRDDALVPLRFAGLGLGLTGGYARRTTHFDFEVRTRLALAGVWERYGNGGMALLPWLDTALRVELPSDSQWRLRVGPWLGVHETRRLLRELGRRAFLLARVFGAGRERGAHAAGWRAGPRRRAGPPLVALVSGLHAIGSTRPIH